MRAICMDKACGMHVDPGVMMAADAPMDVLEDLMSRREKVYITNINSPQSVGHRRKHRSGAVEWGWS